MKFALPPSNIWGSAQLSGGVQILPGALRYSRPAHETNELFGCSSGDFSCLSWIKRGPECADASNDDQRYRHDPIETVMESKSVRKSEC